MHWVGCALGLVCHAPFLQESAAGVGAAGEASEACHSPAVTCSRIYPFTVTSGTPQPQIQALPGAPLLEIAPGSQKQLTSYAAKLLHFFISNTSEASALSSDHSLAEYLLQG